MSGTIPVVSLRGPNTAAALRQACETAGFFYVVDHGVPAAQVVGLFEQARALFDLPVSDKAAISIAHSPAMRGFEAIGSQTLDAESLPDFKESFYCGNEHPPSHPYVQRGLQGYGANQWPAVLPGMAAACAAYIGTLTTLAQRLMALLAESLGEPAQAFGAALGDPMITLRLLRYPPHPEGADERLFGAGAHTDWGAVTILAQDRHGGLEVQMPDGRWVAAPPLEGSFVVNLGDMMPRWTNGRFRSNPHRVRNVSSGGAPRYSIPFFFSPDYMTRVAPLPSCVSAAQPARYAACTVGEHLREMYEKTYGLKAA